MQHRHELTGILILLAVAGGWRAEAQTNLAKAVKPANFEVVAQKTKRTRVAGGDFDDKTQQFQFTVKIRNRELTQNYANLTAWLYVYGKAINRDEYRMFDKTNRVFNLPAKKEYVMEGSPVATEFDDTGFAQYGFKYDGYLVVIRNADEEIIFTKAARPTFVKNCSKLDLIDIGDDFNKEGDKIDPRRRW